MVVIFSPGLSAEDSDDNDDDDSLVLVSSQK